MGRERYRCSLKARLLILTSPLNGYQQRARSFTGAASGHCNISSISYLFLFTLKLKNSPTVSSLRNFIVTRHTFHASLLLSSHSPVTYKRRCRCPSDAYVTFAYVNFLYHTAFKMWHAAGGNLRTTYQKQEWPSLYLPSLFAPFNGFSMRLTQAGRNFI